MAARITRKVFAVPHHGRGSSIKLLVAATAAAMMALSGARAEQPPQDLCKSTGTADEKILQCSALIDSRPDDKEILARAHYRRGNGYADKRQHAQAIEDYTRAIELKPNFHQALHN